VGEGLKVKLGRRLHALAWGRRRKGEGGGRESGVCPYSRYSLPVSSGGRKSEMLVLATVAIALVVSFFLLRKAYSRLCRHWEEVYVYRLHHPAFADVERELGFRVPEEVVEFYLHNPLLLSQGVEIRCVDTDYLLVQGEDRTECLCRFRPLDKKSIRMFKPLYKKWQVVPIAEDVFLNEFVVGLTAKGAKTGLPVLYLDLDGPCEGPDDLGITFDELIAQLKPARKDPDGQVSGH
jgi:hypothetical protein